VAPAEIGVAARSRAAADAALAVLTAAGLPATALAQTDPPDGTLAVGTMHRMKGLEFRCMAVVCLNDHLVPASVTPEADDPITHAQDVQRERCLVFVACTRAREQLSVTWYGTVSRFLGSTQAT
jgi:superfamily I DNA/RNA helicase